MAKRGSRNQIGELNIRIDADSVQAERALKKIRTETKKTAADVDKSTKKAERGVNRLGGGLGRLGRATEERIEGLDRFQSALSKTVGLLGGLTAALGLTTLAFKAGQAAQRAFVSLLSTGADNADKFRASLDFSDVEGSINSLDNRLQKLNSQLAARSENLAKEIIGLFSSQKTFGQLREELEELEQSRISLEKTRRARERRLAREQFDEETRLLEQRIELERREGVDRLFQEKRFAIEELNNIEADLTEEQIARRRRAIDEEFRLRIRAAVEEKREAARIAEEKARKEQEALEKAGRRASQTIEREISASIDNALQTFSLESISKDVRESAGALKVLVNQLRARK